MSALGMAPADQREAVKPGLPVGTLGSLTIQDPINRYDTTRPQEALSTVVDVLQLAKTGSCDPIISPVPTITVIPTPLTGGILRATMECLDRP